ncbi:GAF domain-containing protein [Aphanothece sacrum]|uniref:Capsular polysaccharide synthesis enzyme Cap8N n=1 Tax=Aphanothece sacrum FPU1 TaxID=1920663 RepID=A0A401IGB8_APHSA|nr:hypothetical protein [Aphanothece sacrum]GBF80318.1 capsular polysaccharide synthesis enzyme Cap8N [Aphanothece sacrum FPU1]GBF83725.1 capsular polysaccharide biosynthesis protein [Aphanothece sacrum FPU3]
MPLDEANKLDLQKQLHTLNEVNKSLIGCETIEEVITKALQQVRYHLNVQVASIFLFNKDGYIQGMGINGIDKDRQEIDGKKFLRCLNIFTTDNYDSDYNNIM